MKRIFIILVTFFTSITIEAQIFNRVYDNNNLYDGVLTITETPSGYLMGGTTQDIFSGYVATYLIHIDFNGDTLWTKEHNLSASGEIGYSILKSFDGNYVLCGTMHDTATTTAAAYLMKINAQGDS
ncbi:MAG: hypothetical protein RQ875_14280, partial [Vicingaceae bacterium]|nr:hypothetical protein [Vicingaceae bacterium]